MKKISVEALSSMVGGDIWCMMRCVVECQSYGCTNPWGDCYWACEYAVQ